MLRMDRGVAEAGRPVMGQRQLFRYDRAVGQLGKEVMRRGGKGTGLAAG